MAKKDGDPNELVAIKHPGLKGSGTTNVTRRAFEKVWKSKGYQLEEAAAATTDTGSTTTDNSGDTAIGSRGRSTSQSKEA